MITADRQSWKGVVVGRRATRGHQASWTLCLWWLLATTSAAVPSMLQEAYWLSPAMRDLEWGPWWLLVSLAFDALIGLTIGVLQSILLAKEHLKAFPWIVSSTCAWIATHVVWMIMDKVGFTALDHGASLAYRLLLGLVYALIVGVIVGLIQGMGMVPSRSWSWAGWWALAVTLGFVLAEWALQPTGVIANLFQYPAQIDPAALDTVYLLESSVYAVVSYAILGFVCGMALVWLLLLDSGVRADAAHQIPRSRLRIRILPVRDATPVASQSAVGSRLHPTRVRRVPVELLDSEYAAIAGGHWLKRTELAIVAAMGFLVLLPIVVVRAIPWLMTWSTS